MTAICGEGGYELEEDARRMVEAHFNPRAASKDAEKCLERYAARSIEARRLLTSRHEVGEDLQ